MHFGTTPAAAAYKTLSVGSRGAEVRSLQDYLAQVGLLAASDVDGIFGSITQNAVKNLQYRWQRAQTGIADGETQVLLGQSVANGLPPAPEPVTEPYVTENPATRTDPRIWIPLVYVGAFVALYFIVREK